MRTGICPGNTLLKVLCEALSQDDTVDALKPETVMYSLSTSVSVFFLDSVCICVFVSARGMIMTLVSTLHLIMHTTDTVYPNITSKTCYESNKTNQISNPMKHMRYMSCYNLPLCFL